jgi:AAA family ATP:ADP antiporter
MNAARDEAGPHPLRALLRLRPGEGRRTLLAATGFFCALYAYSILRPLREAAGLQGGTAELPWLFAATLGATLVVALVVAELSRRAGPRSHAIAVLLVVAASLCAIAPFLDADGSPWIARAFYVQVSVLNLLVVSTWFSWLADQFRGDEALRLYGLVGAGGTLGAFLGANTTAHLHEQLGGAGLLYLSAAVFALAAPCALAFPAGAPAARRAHAGGAGPAWEGLALLPRRPILAAICGYTFFHTLSGTFLYFVQAETVAAQALDRAGRTALFAQIDAWTQGSTLVLQLFVAERLARRAGPAFSLAVQPACCACAGVALWWALEGGEMAPVAGMAAPIFALVVAQVAVRASHFATARPVREALYAALSPEEKYKAKAAIDTFVYRAGDALGAWAFDGFLRAAAGLGGTALLLAPLGLGWIALARGLGRMASSRLDSAKPVGDGGDHG